MTPPPFDQLVTFLYTGDLKATATFYEEVLSLPLALDQGTCRIYQPSPNAFLGFCQRAEGPAPDGVIATFVTQEVEAWHARLLEAGVAIEKPPTYNPTYNIFHCFFRDNNGYLLEVQRFCDPTWPSP